MKNVFLPALACVLFACTSTKKIVNHSGDLNGAWIPTKQELGGKELPAAAFEKYRLTIADSIYTYGTSDIDKGTLKYRQGKMDIFGKAGVNAGKHFTAIYKMDGELLTICYNLKGDSYPEGYQTEAKPSFFLSVFKKESAK